MTDTERQLFDLLQERCYREGEFTLSSGAKSTYYFDSKMLFMRGMDLILCCNVLIYFDGASKSKVINHFFTDLNFGGYFFLGTSESLMKLNDQFHLVHFPGTIAYWKPSLSSGKL